MPKTLAEVSRDAAALTSVEQLKLARLLLDLADTAQAPIQDAQGAWDTEIERRLQELRSGAVQPVPLAEVKQRIEARFAL